MNDETCTLKDLQEAIGIAERTIARKLDQQGAFPIQPMAAGKGRPAKYYKISDLPEDWRRLFLIKKRDDSPASESVGVMVSSSNKPVPRNGNGASARPEAGLRQDKIDKGLAAGRLLALYKDFIKRKKPGWGKVVKVKEDFVAAYNLGEQGPYPEIFKVLGKTSWKSLERWDVELRKVERPDPLLLADRRGLHRKGKITVTEEQQRILRSIALSPNKPFVSEVIRSAKRRMEHDGIECSQSDDTFRRWLMDFQSSRYDEWVLYREGEKALNEKCVFHVTRDTSRIDVGDIVVADGHSLNFEIINPWTGKPQRMTLVGWYDMKSHYFLGWEIMPTESTQAISMSLYRAILVLGKIPKVIYLDNGRAFRAKFFCGAKDFEQEAFPGLYWRLGAIVVFAWPYHAESKPVEGFFRIFAELERLAPTYTGTSIKDKPARMKRNEKLHRRLHEIMTGGRAPTIEEAHVAIAGWLDEEYHRRPQDGQLAGRSPSELFLEGKGPGLSEEEMWNLRLLMSEVPVKSIPRDGFLFPWCEERFYHPDLYGRRRQSAIVRYDWQDKTKVYVYTPENEFICEASAMPKVHPMAGHLGTEEDEAELKRQIEMKRHSVKETMGPARKFLEEHVIPEVRRGREEIGFGAGALPPVEKKVRLAVVRETGITEEEKAAALAELEELERLNATDGPERVVDVEEVEPEVIREEDLVWEKLPRMMPMERYETLLELQARRREIPLCEMTWMAMYERTQEYARHKEYFEQHQTNMAMLYQSDE